MTKEEVKQYLRNQIESCILIQDSIDKDRYFLCYNKQYLRAKKFSTITGQPVNKEDFKGGEALFGINTKYFWCYSKIRNYLNNNYSIVQEDRLKLLKEVFNEYEEYKDYKYI